MTLLDEKRLEINDTDTQLVQLFEQRMHCSQNHQYKLEHALILITGRQAQNILRTRHFYTILVFLIILNLGIAYTMQGIRRNQDCNQK